MPGRTSHLPGPHLALSWITMVWSPSKASQSVCCFHSPPLDLLIYVYFCFHVCCSFGLTRLCAPREQNPSPSSSVPWPQIHDRTCSTHSIIFWTHWHQNPSRLLTTSLTCKYHLEKPCCASLTNHQVTHSATQKRKSGTGSQLSPSPSSIWVRYDLLAFAVNPKNKGFHALPEDAYTVGSPSV